MCMHELTVYACRWVGGRGEYLVAFTLYNEIMARHVYPTTYQLDSSPQ